MCEREVGGGRSPSTPSLCNHCVLVLPLRGEPPQQIMNVLEFAVASTEETPGRGRGTRAVPTDYHLLLRFITNYQHMLFLNRKHVNELNIVNRSVTRRRRPHADAEPVEVPVPAGPRVALEDREGV